MCSPPARPVVQPASLLFSAARRPAFFCSSLAWSVVYPDGPPFSTARRNLLFFKWKHDLPARPALRSVLSFGLTGDRRRPNGLILNPWYRGRSLVWDATVVDTFTESHYIVIAAIPGSVATDAETDKCQKYNDHLDSYYFQPVAIETTGVYGKSTALFLSCLAKKLFDISGDPREGQ